MNIKDITLILKYKLSGVEKSVLLDCDSVKNGFENDDIMLRDCGCDNAVKILLTVKNAMELTVARIDYDRFFETNEKFFANGYQSWTTSKEYGRGDLQHGLRSVCKLKFARKYAGVSGDYHFTEYGKDLYHSFTYTYLRNGSKVELFGSLNERTGYTVFYADMGKNLFSVVKDVEGLSLEQNIQYELFDYVKAVGSYNEVFDAYFGAYPKKHTGRVDHLAGYTSWYNYFQNINEEIILRDLEGLKRAADLANIFQIDDGYETYVGDWDLDTIKFPNGMRTIVDKIHAQGIKAGLWIAPFSAQFKANVVKEHPDWLILDKNGKPQFSGVAWGGFYALDIEKPEVRNYIKAYFDKVFDEWDFDMVKLDFLYSACIQPRNNKTRGQLMCEAMDFLRECCRDKIILGCGVPLGPSFGIVDACRISCDVELSFKDRYYVNITNQEIISARHAMNNTVFRRHLNGRIMANDPDVFFLRDDGAKPAKYTMEQKKLLAKINNMFGSVLFVSDDINAYDDEKLDILKASYKKFEGSVELAEFVDSDNMRIIYTQNGKRHVLTYNVYSGVNYLNDK